MTTDTAFWPDVALESERAQGPAGVPYHGWRLDDGSVIAEFYRQPGGFLARYPDLVDFHVSGDGARCSATPVPGADARLVRHYFVGHIRPLMMNRAGWQVHHGSAVEVAGGAVAFLGASGQGKSTIAAAFSRAGHRYVSDDILCIDRDEANACRVTPIEASLRLREQSFNALVEPESDTARAAEVYMGKSRIRDAAEFPFCPEPRRLRAAFFLRNDGGPAIRIAPLTGAEAHVAWVAASFLIDVVGPDALTRQMREVAALVAEVPSFSLVYPRDFACLEDVRCAVLSELQALEGRNRPFEAAG